MTVLHNEPETTTTSMENITFEQADRLPATEQKNMEPVREAIEKLSYREREILRLCGILKGDGNQYTQEEIGRIFKITRNRVLEIKHEALEKLRKFIDDQV